VIIFFLKILFKYHFPFDVQDLSITVTSKRTTEEILITQDMSIQAKMTKSASLDKHIWKLYDHVNIKMHIIKSDLPQVTEDNNFLINPYEAICSHSAITMQCRVSRKPGYFVINCMLPTLMITLCVFFTFMIDHKRYQYRFSLLFTTMLTSITFRWAIHGRVLPTISYLTFLDVYCVTSILIVFSAMCWHAAYVAIHKVSHILLLFKLNKQIIKKNLLNLKDYAELADEYDRYSMLCFAIAVLIAHIFQTGWFIVAYRKRLHFQHLDNLASQHAMKRRSQYSSSQMINVITQSQQRPIDGANTFPNPNRKNTIRTDTTPTTNYYAFNRVMESYDEESGGGGGPGGSNNYSPMRKASVYDANNIKIMKRSHSNERVCSHQMKENAIIVINKNQTDNNNNSNLNDSYMQSQLRPRHRQHQLDLSFNSNQHQQSDQQQSPLLKYIDNEPGLSEISESEEFFKRPLVVNRRASPDKNNPKLHVYDSSNDKDNTTNNTTINNNRNQQSNNDKELYVNSPIDLESKVTQL
jgi:hypothetical protein